MNTHGQPDSFKEMMARDGDLLPAVVLSTTWPTVPASSLTLSPFPTRAYVRDGTDLVYVDQGAAPLTLTGADGTFWLAVHRDTRTPVASWTRSPSGGGTHYLWRSAATAPADPPGGLLFAQVIVAGGIITGLNVAQANPRTRVAFSGPTGALAFDSRLIWDQAIAGLGVGVSPSPGYVLTVQGPVLQAGGPMGIGGVPSYPLDVFGDARFGTRVGIGVGPAVGYNLTVQGPVLQAGGIVGLGGAPSYQLDVFGRARFGAEVGIGADPGGTPGYLLDVNGNTLIRTDLRVNGQALKFGTAWTDLSDVRLKMAIAPMDDALGLVCQLRGVTYAWTEPGHAAALPGTQYGLLAQEVQRVVPQWVGEQDGYLTLTTNGLDAMLIEALKQVVARLEALEAG